MKIVPNILESLNSSADLLKTRGIDTARLDAELLLAHTLGIKRVTLLTNLSRPLNQKELKTFRELIQLRASREPVAYILREKEFWSIVFKVDKRVLIPRPETELLVQCVLDHMHYGNHLQGVDIGTGSGVIPIVLAKELDQVKIVAIDCSDDALCLAKENAKAHSVEKKIRFLKGDLFFPLKKETLFDFIVSNPPYIPKGDIEALEPEVNKYEPLSALDGGVDGLEIIKKIIKESPVFLKRGGLLFLELGAGQWQRVKNLILRNGKYEEPQIFKDYSGIERIVMAQRRM